MASRSSETMTKMRHRARHSRRDLGPGGAARPRADCASVLDDVLLGELAEDVGRGPVAGLVRGFIDLVPRRLAAVRRAADSRDAMSLKEMSHSLEGSAAYVGAHRVVSTCRSLEAVASAGDLDAAKCLIDELDHALDAAVEALVARWLA